MRPSGCGDSVDKSVNGSASNYLDREEGGIA